MRIQHSTPLCLLIYKFLLLLIPLIAKSFPDEYNNVNSGGNFQFRSRGGRGRTCPNNGGFGHANKPIFQIYGKIGHVAAKCYGRFDISFLGIDSINSVSSSRQTNVVFTSNSTYHEWYDDSCATNHVTIDMNNLNIKANYMGNEKLMVGNGSKLTISHVRNSFLPCKNSSKPLLLNIILHVSHITKNLLSISQFTKDNNVLIEFYHDYCLIKDKASKKILVEEALRNGLYQLDFP